MSHSSTPNQTVARIGLIADTHMPYRWRELPTAVTNLFTGVDFILHAGDVGQLWVLDALSHIAPVIAVHGNDDSPEATRELPYQQLVSIAGQRLLLWHSHYADPAAEHASRTGDISPARNIAAAQRVGANVVLFGHWHIPFTYEQDGVLVINPGAIASGNLFHRQTVQSVAQLWLSANGRIQVTHHDLANPQRPFAPQVEWSAGFAANLAPYQQPIYAPPIMQCLTMPAIRQDPALQAAQRPLLALLHRLSFRVWDGEIEQITIPILLDALATDQAIPETAVCHIHTLLEKPVA